MTDKERILTSRLLKVAADIIDGLVTQVKEASELVEKANKVAQLEKTVEELREKLGTKVAADPVQLLNQGIEPDQLAKVANSIFDAEIVDETTESFTPSEEEEFRDFFLNFNES